MKYSSSPLRKLRIMILVLLILTLPFFVMSCGSKQEKHGPEAVEKHSEKQGKPESKGEEGTVTLKPESLQTAGIKVEEVRLLPYGAVLSATAVIELNADRVSKISPRVTGKIAGVFVSQGDRVAAGQRLAMLDSVDLDQAWADYTKARGKKAWASKNLEREERLFEKKVAPEKDVQRARQELNEATADVTLSAERLGLLGVDTSSVVENNSNDDPNSRPRPRPLIPINSPLAGIVVEKTVTQGEMVGPEKALFTVADLSNLWVLIDIYEKDLSRVKRGMPVKLSVAAFPDRAFHGTIRYVGDLLDENTRTVKARVVIDNRNGMLKPGMFASVLLDIKDVSTAKTIVLPEEAIFVGSGGKYVFVQQDKSSFVVRPVTVSEATGKKLEVIEGLREGEVVVVKGVFALKAEMKKEALGHE
jgi:cobalt-zinc-cadmium efflux system membrane fusion protein